jgi:DNA ligase (NAD+)
MAQIANADESTNEDAGNSADNSIPADAASNTAKPAEDQMTLDL